jgi:hypothetical protein
MSWCTLTPELAFDIDRARDIRDNHTPRWTLRGRVCDFCRERWGRFGCADWLWATDLLSRLSKLLLPNSERPPRPRNRHSRRYTAKVTRAAAQARHAYRKQLLLSHHRHRPQPVRAIFGG